MNDTKNAGMTTRNSNKRVRDQQFVAVVVEEEEDEEEGATFVECCCMFRSC